MVTIPKAEYEYLKSQVQWLCEQFLLSKKRQYGASSEKSEYRQIDFLNEAETAAVQHVPEPDAQDAAPRRRKQVKRGIDKLPDDLPVEVVEHALPETEQICSECGKLMHVMGKETREELKFIPAHAVIVRHVRYAYACRECEKSADSVPVKKAQIPNPVIKGSFTSPEAIAHIATQKFVMGVPLYRQEQEWARQGIELSRQTMSNWLLKATEDWLFPVYDALKIRLLRHEVLHADETTLQVLREDGKPAQSKSFMWLFRTGSDARAPIVLYDYQPDRRADRPREFLEGFNGYLHADGYSGYHGLQEEIVVVGCWAHARRKFDEVLAILPKKDWPSSGALQGKRFCDRIFSMEHDLSGLPPDERMEKRQNLARPILDEFLLWLNAQARIVGKHAFGKAVRYTLGQWEYLERYLLDGRLEVSNNRAERSVKPFVIGRKNWLFANTPKGAKASAVLYSLIETAKENGLNPFEYLVHIFKTAPNIDLEDPHGVALLLPDNAPEYSRAIRPPFACHSASHSHGIRALAI